MTWALARCAMMNVIAGHAARCEPLLEPPAHCLAVELRCWFDGPDGFLYSADNPPGYAMVDHLSHRAAIERNYRSSAGHGLDHHKAERFRPINGKEERRGVAEEARLLVFINLAANAD
jgi:hypothetical protein